MAVVVAPMALTARRRRQPGSRWRHQRATRAAWERVKAVKTPIPYSGSSPVTLPRKRRISAAATAARMMIPLLKARRSPRKAKWRGRNLSRAMK